jgi:hypothetical protein
VTRFHRRLRWFSPLISPEIPSDSAESCFCLFHVVSLFLPFAFFSHFFHHFFIFSLFLIFSPPFCVCLCLSSFFLFYLPFVPFFIPSLLFIVFLFFLLSSSSCSLSSSLETLAYFRGMVLRAK